MREREREREERERNENERERERERESSVITGQDCNMKRERLCERSKMWEKVELSK